MPSFFQVSVYVAYLRSTAQCFLYARHWIIINTLKTRTFIQWNNNVVTAHLFLVITLYQALCISFHPQEAQALGTSWWRRTPAYMPGGSGASLLLGLDSPTSFIHLAFPVFIPPNSFSLPSFKKYQEAGDSHKSHETHDLPPPGPWHLLFPLPDSGHS